MQENFVIAENLYKQKILLNPQDPIGQKILTDGIYDRTGLFFIENILSQLNRPTVLDIGASIGNHALRMQKHCQQIYLFEPQANIAAQLHRTMELNNIHNWTIFNFGLSDENKSLALYKNLKSNGETSFVAELKGEKFIIEESYVKIGDEVVRDNNIDHVDFIKIDVEGFEARVISGLQNTIIKYRPIIFMEWNKTTTKQQFSEYDLLNKIFNNYLIKAMIRNPAESTLYKKILGALRRTFSKETRKRWVLGEFTPQANYRHIVFIPKEKANLF